MKSIADFLSMGGYALYVWGSYGLTAIVLIAEVISLRKRERIAASPGQIYGQSEQER
jgi:heme exporter protein D